PVYITALRATLRCPVILLVLAPDEAVGRWATGAIDIGHPGFTLVPIVVTLADVPRVTDPALAHRVPELAVLSALAHADREVLETALGAILELPEDTAKLYLDVVLRANRQLDLTPIEAAMKGYVYKSNFARHYLAKGREE